MALIVKEQPDLQIFLSTVILHHDGIKPRTNMRKFKELSFIFIVSQLLDIYIVNQYHKSFKVQHRAA